MAYRYRRRRSFRPLRARRHLGRRLHRRRGVNRIGWRM